MTNNGNKNPATGLTRIWRAFQFSMSGLRHALTKETAFQQEFGLFIVLLPVLFFLPVPLFLKILLLLANTGVLIVELLNSAIESVVDKASPEYHQLAKQAKDMGSAAVLLANLAALCLWGYAISVALS